MPDTPDVFSQIQNSIAGLERPLLVGINGAYTSGKTVFAGNLQARLQAEGIKTQLIHYDDFHNPFPTIHWKDASDELEAFYNRAFTPNKLIADVLAPLKAHGCVDKYVECIDLGTGEFTNTIHFDIDRETVVLLEGVLLFRPPLLDYLDYKIYLDISDDEILRRARERDVPRFGEAIYDKFITRYIPVQHRYVAECRPKEVSDIVVDNNDYGNPRIMG